ncbi:hypothetical protein COCMIDRAFT_88881 [Bipolaris oryzae ATCC 44560]|uniref:RRM domain-containing protein n=1 Tax=Bipolaris oryzae ATCC 44560 TaxID=930090 RepID=W6ZVP7_COCMI|nr:uncharacterized protein COCMIDRAFT_88881 [Bipolaris oryzae ATCC 44560]EUC47851.1 hypothetical protein COCMIDRAFT_88881 [Bipolaris oryzae ATCC 44560]
MSKSKVDNVEKKRKRDTEVAEDVPKKSKKSKKVEDSQDAPAVEAVEVKKEKKEKKDKKDKKSKKDKDIVEAPATEDAVEDAKKEKKEKKSKKSKKSKDVDASEDAPAEEAALIDKMKKSENFISVNDDEPMPDATDAPAKKDKKKEKKEKKDKEPKKSKKSKDEAKIEDTPMEDAAEEQSGTAEPAPVETNGADTESKSEKKEKKKDKKEKKEKKDKKEKKAKKSEDAEINGETAVETNGEAPAETNGEAAAEDAEVTEEVNAEEAEEAEAAVEANQGRFIVFVGNLPYSATKEQIEKHFEKIKPSEIRLRTYKGSDKFMGTCFVEFDRFDRMVTCLKKYHHSVFPDPKKKEGRKINVELSAGGGGNSEARRSKIAAKNEKLHDERARDRVRKTELEMKQSERKQKKEAKSGKKGEDAGAEEAEAPEKPSEAETFGMNPARLAMMQGPQRPAHRSRY